MFRNNTDFAIKIKKRFDLSEPEIKYLLGPSHKHKLNEILHYNEIIIEKVGKPEEEKPVEKEKKEKMQQSLLDF